MVPDRTSAVAVALLVVAALLLANPLYLQEPDRGNQVVEVVATTPAEGVASRTPSVTQTDHLPVVARYAAVRGIENGSFSIDRHAPPLAIQLLDREWRYVAAHRGDLVYAPTVTVGANTTTVRFTPVNVTDVEAELGVTPPDSLANSEEVRRVVWLAEESDAVVFVGQLDDDWEDRIASGVSDGELRVPNRNDGSVVAPLGGEVGFVVDGATPYRATVAETESAVVLEFKVVSNRTILAESGVRVVDTDTLSPATHEVVVAAIEDGGYYRYDGAAVDMDEIERAADGVVRHDGQYYLLYRSHVDGFSLVPMIQFLLFMLGSVLAAVGVVFAIRARGQNE